jgi:rRNA-processing protein FCF1
MIYQQSCQVSVPVFGVNSYIQYQTIRRPTVFEKSILQLLARYRNELGNQRIDQIAGELKASPLFFLDGIQYLIDFNAIQIMPDLSLDEGETLPLNSFDITAEGKEFLVNNALPSSNKNERDEHFYHPISRQLVSKNRLKSGSGNETAMDADALNVTLATVDGIVEESIREKWKNKANIKIGNVESELSRVLWDNRSISLEFDCNSNLKVASKDNLLKQWLDGLDGEFLWTEVLQHSFSNNSEVKLPLFNWKQVDNLAAIDGAKQLAKTSTSKLVVSKEKIDNNNIPSIFISTESGLSFRGNTLSLSDKQFSVDDSLYSLNIDNNLNATEVHSGNTSIHFSGQPRIVDLAVKLNGSVLWDDISKYLLETDDLDAVLFSSILGVNQSINRLPVRGIKEVNSYYQRMKGLVSKLSPNVFENKVRPLENLNELEQYQTMFSNNSLDNEKLMPSCIKELILRSLSVRKAFTRLEITPGLSEFSKAYFAMQDIAGKSYFETGELSKVTADIRLLKLVNEWKVTLSKLTKVVPSACMDLPELEQVQDRIMQLEEYILSSFAPVRGDKKRVVVIDTNCLMHKLHLLDQIKPSDWLVIPTVVLNELDGLKTDVNKDEISEKARLARKAIDRLGRFSGDEHYEQQHLRLLKKNKNNSADAKVLSVAAYYRLGKVLLITEDKNLRNMAHAENIPNQSVNNYLGNQGKDK